MIRVRVRRLAGLDCLLVMTTLLSTHQNQYIISDGCWYKKITWIIYLYGFTRTNVCISSLWYADKKVTSFSFYKKWLKVMDVWFVQKLMINHNVYYRPKNNLCIKVFFYICILSDLKLMLKKTTLKKSESTFKFIFFYFSYDFLVTNMS